MKKQDIADIRRQFKLNNNLLTISEIFKVYVRKESNEVFHEESQPFQMLAQDEQELFLNNFKKMLTGKLDVKLFNVKFATDLENSSQFILNDALEADTTAEWNEQMLQIVAKIFQDVQYEFDIVVTFIRGQYAKKFKKGETDNDESRTSSQPFILCTLNKTEIPKTSLLFDFVERQFKSNVAIDPVINLTSPLGGFLFPAFPGGYANVNKILYGAGRPNKPDFHFIKDVLNGEDIVTAEEDKVIFEEVVKEVVGEKVAPNTLANVYDEINDIIKDDEEEGEDSTLNYRDLERVLLASGVEDVNSDKIEMALKKVISDEKHQFKASNILPNFNTKSIKINTEVANISISPQHLNRVKQVNLNGKRCLLIEVEEDAEIEGFKLVPELETFHNG